jgi:hypothetical protein
VNKSEVVIELGAEGGSITLSGFFKRPTPHPGPARHPSPPMYRQRSGNGGKLDKERIRMLDAHALLSNSTTVASIAVARPPIPKSHEE